MTHGVVSLLGVNVDEAAIDLADHLTASGVGSAVASANHVRRRELVDRREAGIVWMCGWLALETRTSAYDVVAAPNFAGERPASYHSVIVARRPYSGLEELSGERAIWAMNEPVSWSGHLAVLAECERRGVVEPSRIVWSGSHADSIRMVSAGTADAAAIDSTLWRWAASEDVAVVDETRSWPAPPILVRRDLLDRLPELPTIISAARAVRGIDGFEHADWAHLQPLSRGSEP